MKLEKQEEIKRKTLEYLNKAGIVLTDNEKKNKIQILDYGVEDFYTIGLVAVTFVNTERYCGKYLLFFPGQSVGEHWHPNVKENIGKEETLRVLWGMAYAYVEGEPTKNIKAKIPEGKEKVYTCRHEIILKPGDQYIVSLHEKHWWQGGPEGFVALEVSTTSRDKFDEYTDKDLKFNIY